MKFKPQLMTIVSAAGPIAASAQVQVKPLSISRFSDESQPCREGWARRPILRAELKPVEPAHKFNGQWLYAEDEYLPFNADGFEER